MTKTLILEIRQARITLSFGAFSKSSFSEPEVSDHGRRLYHSSSPRCYLYRDALACCVLICVLYMYNRVHSDRLLRQRLPVRLLFLKAETTGVVMEICAKHLEGRNPI